MQNARRRQVTALLAGALLTAGAAFAAPASAASTTLVTNARWGGHCTYDRLVIDLQGAAPPVTVTPVSELVYDGSGKPVPLPGKYFLEIRLHPAAAHDSAGHNVYVGPAAPADRPPQAQGHGQDRRLRGVRHLRRGLRHPAHL